MGLPLHTHHLVERLLGRYCGRLCPPSFERQLNLGFAVEGDLGPAVKTFKEQFKVYPLARQANPPTMKFINGSGLYFNTIQIQQGQ